MINCIRTKNIDLFAVVLSNIKIHICQRFHGYIVWLSKIISYKIFCDRCPGKITYDSCLRFQGGEGGGVANISYET